MLNLNEIDIYFFLLGFADLHIAASIVRYYQCGLECKEVSNDYVNKLADEINTMFLHSYVCFQMHCNMHVKK